MESILGREFFHGKEILELGCGHGEISKYLRKNLKGVPTLTEGRKSLVGKAAINNPGSFVHLVDHEKKFNLNKRFDVVINWGLLYHLSSWRSCLQCSIEHMKKDGVMLLESWVMDSNEDKEVFVKEQRDKDDQSLHGRGSRMSAKAIESILSKNNLAHRRYDDSDLNSDFHVYDWASQGNGAVKYGHRRFWIVWNADSK